MVDGNALGDAPGDALREAEGNFEGEGCELGLFLDVVVLGYGGSIMINDDDLRGQFAD